MNTRLSQRRGPIWARTLLQGAAALAVATSTVVAQPAPPTPSAGQTTAPPAPATSPVAVPLSGAVTSYNYGSRGSYEGLMLKSGDKLVQINFPLDAGGFIAQTAAVGDQVSLTATSTERASDHDVYELVTFTPAKGQALTIAGPDAWRVEHIDGAVKSLNYGRRGEVNGVSLHSGDVVRVGPEGAKLVNLAVGQKLSIDGRARSMLTGHKIIEADSINGTKIPTAPSPLTDDPKGRHPRGPHGRRPGENPPPPPAPRESRSTMRTGQ